jgi:hypothetical protein
VLKSEWVLHCSIVFKMNNSDFIKTIRILRDNFEPIDVTIEKIGFIRFRPVEQLYIKSL